MNVKDIDNKISELVREKQLLNKSLKRTNDINEIKGIKKRIIELNGLINIEKSKYSEVEKSMEVNVWKKLKLCNYIKISIYKGGG